MEIELNSMRKEDEVSLVLGNLFESYGYKKYLMSRFEEYSLYMENKDFLISDKIITFTDAGGNIKVITRQQRCHSEATARSWQG